MKMILLTLPIWILFTCTITLSRTFEYNVEVRLVRANTSDLLFIIVETFSLLLLNVKRRFYLYTNLLEGFFFKT